MKRTIKKRKREEDVGFREMGWGRMRQGDVRVRMLVKSEDRRRNLEHYCVYCGEWGRFQIRAVNPAAARIFYWGRRIHTYITYLLSNTCIPVLPVQ